MMVVTVVPVVCDDNDDIDKDDNDGDDDDECQLVESRVFHVRSMFAM